MSAVAALSPWKNITAVFARGMRLRSISQTGGRSIFDAGHVQSVGLRSARSKRPLAMMPCCDGSVPVVMLTWTGQVTAGKTTQEVWIQVSDTGPGILPEEQERVFEPFYRSEAQRRFPQGLGVGLTLARDLVRAHGGELELASTPGESSRFTIRLPL